MTKRARRIRRRVREGRSRIKIKRRKKRRIKPR